MFEILYFELNVVNFIPFGQALQLHTAYGVPPPPFLFLSAWPGPLGWDSMARRFYAPVVDFTRLP